MEATPTPDGAPELTPATSDKTELPKSALSALPLIESPSISPAIETPEVLADVHVPPIGLKTEPKIEPNIESTPESATAVTPAAPLFVLRPRHKRYALLAASVTFAAALGAIVGALATGGSSGPAKPDTAALQESKAMQQSLAKLGKEVTTLKANLEAANKTAHSQMAKISEKLEHASADITGSISAPQTAAPLPAPLPASMAAPLPTPRPRIASIETLPPGRLGVVQDWTIRDWRGGFVYVENHGEIYQVVLGAPLPGLGPVESVKRQDGRWVVTTSRGLIVSMRDRRYFQEF
jgi:hypothetical protein